jgi:hypothetical protein
MVSSHHVSPDRADVPRSSGGPDNSTRTCPGQVSATLDELENRIVRIHELVPDDDGDTRGDDMAPGVPGSHEPPD